MLINSLSVPPEDFNNVSTERIMTENMNPTQDPLDDIFISNSSAYLNNPEPGILSTSLRDSERGGDEAGDGLSAFQLSEVSEVPRIRSIHNTAGYRDGISASKTKFIQEGFDEGYSLGGEIGRRVGWILGALEGLLTATTKADSTNEQQTYLGEKIRKALLQAKQELAVENVFGEKYFQQDGLWSYEVKGNEEESTFQDVGLQHPLIKTWSNFLKSTTEEVGCDLDSLGRIMEEPS